MKKERPILFSGPMVKAILDGRKTQTRRVVKPQLDPAGGAGWESIRYFSGVGKWCLARRSGAGWTRAMETSDYPYLRCPYGQPGDGLWVKETHQWCDDMLSGYELDDANCVLYRADMQPYNCCFDPPELIPGQGTSTWNLAGRKCRPSIFMPRWASRIDLELLDVRVERVQDISEADARAEGTECRSDLGWDYAFDDPGDPYENAVKHGHRAAFRDLWDSINAAPKPVKVGGRLDHYVSYPWEDIHETRTHRGLPWLVMGNPWVWALTFERKGA